jgi:prepilin-type N-terminal cleavage/methylation domain-containing protein
MRRGVSLLEVLISILIVSIGLLAALTVFPVASAIAKKGEVADNVAVMGRSAIHDFDTRGMRQPARWMAWNQAAGAYQNYAPTFNESFCIDPRGMAANSATPLAIEAFPYSATAVQPRMRRLTLASGAGGPMSLPLANSIFQLDDDLTVVRPADSSLPAFGTVTDGVRTSNGHFSWMATVVPQLELHNGPATPIPTLQQDYILSVVIFHDRPGDMLAGDPIHERVVTCDFADAGGTGFAGGEVYLTWAAPQTPANDTFAEDVQLHLRAGEWVMLARGVQHASGPVFPTFRWYKVADCDREPEYHAAESHYALAASLAGPDWDTSPGETIAVLMEGVVGVYEKTIRLDR